MTMRARICMPWAIVVSINFVAINFAASTLLAISGSTALGQPSDLQYAMQLASCPTILPAEEGERSIVVPNEAPNVAPPADALRVASLPKSPEQEAAQSLLKEKLAQRDQLQREIAALRESTQTPEQILVRVKVLEVNLTKLRQANIDLTTIVDGQPQPIDIAALLDGRATGSTGATPSHNYANYASIDNASVGVFAALEKSSLGRILVDPKLVLLDGRAASFHVGGQVPVPGSSDAPATQIDYGTKLDVTATCLGNNRVRLAIHPRITELDNSHAIEVGGNPVPATRVREIDFGSEVEFGKSVVMSGLIQERTVATKSGWSLRTSEETHEIALVVVVTPEMVR
jgi:Flp pilus assembly secretin CpaC